MLPWISENLGTIIISLLLIAAVSAIVVNMLKNRKKGKSPCGCSCGGCAMNGSCHHGK